jgi:transketolase
MMQNPVTYETILRDLVHADGRFIVMTAENRAAIRNLPEQIGPRFIDVGICEQTLIGAAAGLALRGRIPVTHALATFLTLRAFEFIRTDVGIAGLPVKLVGSFSGFISEANGPTHQAIEDVALIRGIPNINVWCPADEEDMLLGLETILRDPAPWYIRYNNAKPVTSHSRQFAPGRAEVFAEGRDVTLLTYGVLFGECFKAAELLREQGLSVGLVNLRSLKPVDVEVLLQAAERSRLLVAVEDHFKIGGLYSILAETLLEHGVKANVLSLALDGRWFKPALFSDLLEYEGFTAPAVAQKVIERLSSLKK